MSIRQGLPCILYGLDGPCFLSYCFPTFLCLLFSSLLFPSCSLYFFLSCFLLKLFLFFFHSIQIFHVFPRILFRLLQSGRLILSRSKKKTHLCMLSNTLLNNLKTRKLHNRWKAFEKIFHAMQVPIV